MATPSALVLKCESCGKEVPHRVLRGRVGGKGEIVFEGVVKWSACGFMRSVVTREAKPIEVPMVLSWMDRSTRTTIEMAPTKRGVVGYAIHLSDERAVVTAVDSNER